jgi:hypothetical protein
MYAAAQAEAARQRGDEAAARYWERIARVVDLSPPLTQTQRDQLAILLRPSRPAPDRGSELRDAA